MKIAIFGLGYVGTVTGSCLADIGHQIIGVDTNREKIEILKKGKSPIIEKDIEKIIKRNVNSGSLKFTNNWGDAVSKTEISLICVGTPSKTNGSIDLTYVKRVCEQIGETIKVINRYHVLAIRSTVLPGTVEGSLIPIIEKCSGKKAGSDFGICMVPEFLREGSSIYDFYNPPRNVIGELNKKSGDIVEKIFEKINAPLIRTEIINAEMLKYADNSFHALKVTFANEIGRICKELKIDSHQVMDIFCMDNKLNLSSYYLKPGFSFGGSCLPKDLRAILYKAKTLDVEVPLLDSILESNKKHTSKVIEKLTNYKGKRLGFFGLSFKGGTDDLRESPIVEVVEAMIGKGFKVKIYDKNVSLAKLFGSNKKFIENEIPHISKLMCNSAEELVESSDIIIIGNYDEDNVKILRSKIKSTQIVYDLVRGIKASSKIDAEYKGICW